MTEGVERTVQSLDDMSFKKQVMARYNGCWFCGLPQEICQRWEKTETGWGLNEGKICQYGTLVFETVLLCWLWGDFSDVLEEWVKGEKLGHGQTVDIEDERSYLRWLGKKIKWGRVETNHWTKVFFRFMQVAEDWSGWRAGWRD